MQKKSQTHASFLVVAYVRTLLFVNTKSILLKMKSNHHSKDFPV